MAMNEYDINLVNLAKSGNTQAFEELYDRYYGKIFALARMTLKNEADAEDILQQAFISAWRNMQSLTNPEAFSTWLQKITLNHCYSLLRRKSIVILMDAESDTEDFSEEISDEFLPAVYAERDDLRQRLGKIIESLSEVQKQTIVLFYFNEQKVEEIAYIMECNVATVKSRLFLARKAIRAEVEEEERKSGEKFYGIAGIPMLALGDFITQHINSQALSGEIISSVLTALSESISQVTVSSSAATGASSAGSYTAVGTETVVTKASSTGGTTVGGSVTSSTATGGGVSASGTVTVATTATGVSAGIKGTVIAAIIVFGLGLGLIGAFLVNNYILNNDTSPQSPDGSEPPHISEPTTTPTPEQTQTPELTPTPEPEPTPEPDLVNFPVFSPQNSITLNFNSAVALKTDGTIMTTDSDMDISGWTNIVALFTYGYGHPHYGLRADGTVISSDRYANYDHWTDIRYVSGGFGLKSDGTVVAGELTFRNWRQPHRDALIELTDVERIFSIGGTTVLATKFDGTFVAVGPSEMAQQAASEWSDIIDISSQYQRLFGLKSDGTMVSILNSDSYTNASLVAVNNWTDIISITSSNSIIMGLKSDGTVVAAGRTEGGLGPEVSPFVSGWTDIVAIACNAYHLYGLRSNGTVVAAGALAPDLGGWSDIIAIWASSADINRVVIGLRADGTVITSGNLSQTQLANGFTDIKTTEN